ncbi:hypothetical protein BCR43DRAFT_513655 [Syncephalastrum racemosum]|uniref:Uncharacterized protein n=1 Tax=Syncephalastrum racemosum TaxID=13706 RepID=A0A1X2HE40_SYNRA|nr:hypothetical protein BCR43DRAFT_513655 [Syncephalastrum racemosum]
MPKVGRERFDFTRQPHAPDPTTNNINRASIARDTKLTNGTYDCLNFLAVRVATGRVQCVELNVANYASSSATLPDGDDAAARSLSPMSISSGLNASVSSISSVLTAFAETAARSFGSTAYSPCDANGSKMKDRQKAKQKLKTEEQLPEYKAVFREPYKEILKGKLSDISAKSVRKTSLEPVVRSGRGPQKQES